MNIIPSLLYKGMSRDAGGSGVAGLGTEPGANTGGDSRTMFPVGYDVNVNHKYHPAATFTTDLDTAMLFWAWRPTQGYRRVFQNM